MGRARFWRNDTPREWYEFEVKLIPTVALFALLVLSVLVGYHIDTPVQAEPKTAAKASQTVSEPVASPEKYPTLVTDMNAALATVPGLSASATLIDLDTSKQYDAGNYTQFYEAASTSKLVGVFDYLHQVEVGKTTLTRTIQGQSAQDIIMRMIIYSDNDAWDKLNGYLKFKPQQAYLDGIGVGGKMVPNNIQFTTPAMARMLQLFYQGDLMNDEHRAMVLDYMGRTTMNKLIPPAVPADAKVYHKYGQIEGVLHDAAIIEWQGRAFVLVVYTDNEGKSGQYAKQVGAIQAVTRAVFASIAQPTVPSL